MLRNYHQPAQLLRNRCGRATGCELRLVGTRSQPRRRRRARSRLRTGGRWQTREVHAGSGYLSQQSLVQHFGLGPRGMRALEVEITWPSGATTHIGELEGSHRFTVTENSSSPIGCVGPACPN